MGKGQVSREVSKAASAPGGRPPQALPRAPCRVLGALTAYFPFETSSFPGKGQDHKGGRAPGAGAGQVNRHKNLCL